MGDPSADEDLDCSLSEGEETAWREEDRSFFQPYLPQHGPLMRDPLWLPLQIYLNGHGAEISIEQAKRQMQDLLEEMQESTHTDGRDLIIRFWQLVPNYPNWAALALSPMAQERIEALTSWENLHLRLNALDLNLHFEIGHDLTNLLTNKRFKEVMTTLEKLTEELSLLKRSWFKFGLKMNGEVLMRVCMVLVNAVIQAVDALVRLYRPLFASPLYDPDVNFVCHLFRQLGQVVNVSLILKYLGCSAILESSSIEEQLENAFLEVTQELGELVWRFYFQPESQEGRIHFGEESRSEMTALWHACEPLVHYTRRAGLYLVNLFG